MSRERRESYMACVFFIEVKSTRGLELQYVGAGISEQGWN